MGFRFPLAALWWDAEGRLGARRRIGGTELESVSGMAVHAYLHRKEATLRMRSIGIARAGRGFIDQSWG